MKTNNLIETTTLLTKASSILSSLCVYERNNNHDHETSLSLRYSIIDYLDAAICTLGATKSKSIPFHGQLKQSNNSNKKNIQLAKVSIPTETTTPQNSFASRLRLALAHSGITQGVLADWTGISQSTISSYVTGKVKEAGFVRSADMARALGVNAKWLIYGEGEMLSAKNLTKDSEV